MTEPEVIGGECPECGGEVFAACDSMCACSSCGSVLQHEADYDAQGDPPDWVRSDHWRVVDSARCPECGFLPTKHAGFHLTETCRCRPT